MTRRTPIKDDPAVGPVEVVIVNAKNCRWIARLQYTLERAGLVLTEDYQINGGQDRILVFNEK